MTERRFLVEGPLVEGAEVALSEGALRHAGVLRLSPGDEVVLFDGRGHEAGATLLGAGTARIGEVRSAGEPWRVVLVLALPRASKLDDLLRGVTEVGASEVRLFAAARSVVQPDAGRVAHKRERWERIAEEAARQSERTVVPRVVGPSSLAEALADAPPGARIVALDARAGASLEEALGATAAPLYLVVGPEGGLDAGELAWLVTRGAVLGRAALPVLRVETAALVLTALGVLSRRR
jgi:16S rRNA (uracil1498-N3)-methyltransferase